MAGTWNYNINSHVNTSNKKNVQTNPFTVIQKQKINC